MTKISRSLVFALCVLLLAFVLSACDSASHPAPVQPRDAGQELCALR